MQISIEALIIALRGAAEALEDSYGPFEPEVVKEKAAPVETKAPEPTPEPKVVQELPPQEADAPWESEQPTPPPAATQPEVSPDDIKGLYQQIAQQGTKVDMLSMLSSLGVQKVGELDGEGRGKLYAMMKKAAGM